MALQSDRIPLFVKGKTPEELTRRIFEVQQKLFGKVAIITIYWDGKQHICWYLPPSGSGGFAL